MNNKNTITTVGYIISSLSFLFAFIFFVSRITIYGVMLLSIGAILSLMTSIYKLSDTK